VTLVLINGKSAPGFTSRQRLAIDKLRCGKSLSKANEQQWNSLEINSAQIHSGRQGLDLGLVLLVKQEILQQEQNNENIRYRKKNITIGSVSYIF
jgi:hypothetical protein